MNFSFVCVWDGGKEGEREKNQMCDQDVQNDEHLMSSCCPTSGRGAYMYEKRRCDKDLKTLVHAKACPEDS